MSLPPNWDEMSLDELWRVLNDPQQREPKRQETNPQSEEDGR